MTDIEIKALEDKYWDKISLPVDIVQTSFGCCLTIYFNDMFGYATSDFVTFASQKNSTVEELLSEFDKWWESEGKSILIRFKEVRLSEPDLSGRRVPDSEVSYFKANNSIREDLVRSINEFCGRELN